MPNIFAANHSNVLVDGQALEGLQSITYDTGASTEEVYAIGTPERIDVSFGKLTVRGELTVISNNLKLEELYINKGKFQIVFKLKKEKGLITEGERTITLDEVFLDKIKGNVTLNKVTTTTYSFTATRVRYE